MAILIGNYVQVKVIVKINGIQIDSFKVRHKFGRRFYINFLKVENFYLIFLFQQTIQDLWTSFNQWSN